MSLSKALASIGQLQMQVMKLQSQIADQEARIKRKVPVVHETAEANQEQGQQPPLLQEQLDKQADLLVNTRLQLLGSHQSIMVLQKKSELSLLLSIFTMMTVVIFILLGPWFTKQM